MKARSLAAALAFALALPLAAQTPEGGVPIGGDPAPLPPPQTGDPAPLPPSGVPTVKVTLIDSNGAQAPAFPLDDVNSALVRITSHKATTASEYELVIVKLGDDSGLIAMLQAGIAAGDAVSAQLDYVLADGTPVTLIANQITGIDVHVRGMDDWDAHDLDDFQRESLRLPFTSLTFPSTGGGAKK